MAEVRSLKSGPAPAHASGLTGLKLRGSCRECAVSKVKCSKEKPTCARCAKRNTTCKYFAAKRPGRAPRSNNQEFSDADNSGCIDVPSTMTDMRMEFGVSDMAALADHSPENMGDLTAFELNSKSLGPDEGAGVGGFESSDLFSGVSAEFQGNLFPDLEGTQSDLEDFLNSDFSGSNAQPTSELGKGASGDIVDLLISDQSDFRFVAKAAQPIHASIPTPSSMFANSQAKAATDVQMSDPDSPTCPCRAKLMGTLEKLMTDGSRPQAVAGDSDDQETQIRGFRRGSNKAQTMVIACNREVISSMTSILQCACEKDGYMLSILAMIIAKLLSRYSEAVVGVLGKERDSKAKSVISASTPVQSLERGHHGSADHDGVGRLMAQEILSELHRVQRLINEVCLQLRSQKGSCRAVGDDNRDCQLPSRPVSRHGELERPFSALTLDGIAKDIRFGLGILSKKLIGLLQEI